MLCCVFKLMHVTAVFFLWMTLATAVLLCVPSLRSLWPLPLPSWWLKFCLCLTLHRISRPLPANHLVVQVIITYTRFTAPISCKYIHTHRRMVPQNLTLIRYTHTHNRLLAAPTISVFKPKWWACHVYCVAESVTSEKVSLAPDTSSQQTQLVLCKCVEDIVLFCVGAPGWRAAGSWYPYPCSFHPAMRPPVAHSNHHYYPGTLRPL